VHNPEAARGLTSGRFDLVLSGHTHGGQVGANMFGLRPTLYGLMGGRDQGWWDAGGARHYVHAGNLLIGFPPRMGVASEVVVLEPAGTGGANHAETGGDAEHAATVTARQ